MKAQPLLPSQNLGDYVAQPPLFLTTVQAMAPFLNSKDYTGALYAATAAHDTSSKKTRVLHWEARRKT